MAKRDEFDHAQFGIFAGSEGLNNVDTMDVEQSADFYSMSRTCEGCGERRECQIEWAELYCLQFGIDPAEVGRAIGRPDVFDTSWQYSPQHKCFHPNYRDNCNGNPLVMFNITPVLAEAALKAAGRNGIMSDAQIGIINTIQRTVHQMYEQRRAGGRPMQRQLSPQQIQQMQMMQQQGYPPGYPQGRR